MKLLIIIPSRGRGGAEEYALTIASAALRKQWNVHIAFAKMNETESLLQDSLKVGLHYHRLEINALGNYRLEGVKNSFLRLTRTLFLLLKVKPDIVLMNLPAPDLCLTSMIACGLLKIPTISVVHLIYSVLKFSSKRLKVYAWLRSRNQQWLTISKNNQRLLNEMFQIPLTEVLCIYNGTKLIPNLDYEDIAELRIQIRRELGISENSRVLLTVAHLRSQKGYDCLIPAISHLIKEFSDLKFVWVGEGTQREDLLNQVRASGIEKNVLFLGYRSDVPRLLKAADLFVFPTYYEGFPFALLEAMSCGLPVISSAASSIPEIIENQVHGLLFRTGDSNDLLKALRWALKHPECMQEMSKNAQRQVQNFSEEKMIAETLEALQQSSCVSV